MNDYDYSSSAANPGVLAAIFGVIFIPFLIIWIISVIGKWKIYEKAGKPGWAAIIPIYNYIVLLEIVGKPVWWIILLLVPCVNIVILIWLVNLLAKSFGQSEGFTIGLLILPMIFYPILGFGNYPYLGPSASEAKFAGMPPHDSFNPNPPQV
ncbi:DUF5684 domain-containing protein [Mucilaginibacter calamicampi]|uniref:DUF5684 domain-containing protein n=1 Tax=Mucilaginibacter calamicampi TaxID=1302352 RepID=A0ABW2YVL5_9SPHI